MGASSRTITSSEAGILPLHAPAATSPHVGAKAANLARALAAGLPVVDGFVIAAELASRVAADRPVVDSSDADRALCRAWAALSRNGSDPVVVRSSSTAEDTAASSQAGVFDSVTDVRGWDAFLDAIAVVVASGTRHGGRLSVLVQRHVDPAWGGVMFGLDPVSGRRDRLVVAAVPGGPQGLVGGTETGIQLLLDRRGRMAEGRRGVESLPLGHRRRLAALASRVERLYGGPQDVEWAITRDGRVLLLQSRPITAAAAVGAGPVLGPGPIAETFPEPLRALEQDLWIPPLREALEAVLPLLGRASHREVRRSPVVAMVSGRPAVDLELLEPPRRSRGLALLDPRPSLRRLRVAWRLGRLRAGLPVLLDGAITDIDAALRDVAPLDELSDDELLGLLRRCQATLRAAHGYELLAGALAGTDGEPGATAAEAALWALAAARATGRGGTGPDADARIIADVPEVLMLLAPTVGARPPLPPIPGEPRPVRALAAREALRLRVRWLHELSARAALVLGHRLAAAGRLPAAEDVADVALDDLAVALRDGRAVARAARPPASLTLPARFQLAADGTVVTATHDHQAGSTGAGGGRGTGPVSHAADPRPGSVLVVATLDPRLAPVLATLAGLVAETGSPLSHLAILAREHGVPTVVGVADARERFPVGTRLLVDGGTGDVEVVAPAPDTRGAPR